MWWCENEGIMPELGLGVSYSQLRIILSAIEPELPMLSVITETSLSPLLLVSNKKWVWHSGNGSQLAENINKSQAITIYTSSVLQSGTKERLL